MKKMNSDLNSNTQPLRKHKIFNNWNIVTKGWYIALPSKELKKGQVKTVHINDVKIIVYRTEKGNIHSLDAFCPHMGVDLGLGKVEGEEIKCFFHHWKFDKNANCTDIPCKEEAPKNLKFSSYSTQEKYGYIWVWPESETKETVLNIPALEGLNEDQIIFSQDKEFLRSCHYHTTMINGIDPQHLSTVHNINIDMNIDIDDSKKNHIEILLEGKFPTTNMKERLGKVLLGEKYSYSMKYADGCVASLTMLKGAKFLNRFKLPELHMIFAYSLVEEGKISVRPIYVNKKGKGILGKITGKLKLLVTKAFFKSLQGEDGLVYENIRFNTTAFLKMDEPIVKYIAHINKLEKSVWSKEI